MRRALAWMAACSVACNAIADNGKYAVVDCPSGSCDGGGSSGLDGAPPPPPSSSDSGGGADTGVDAKPTCASNEGRITLTVVGASGSVSEDRGMFSVSAAPSGNTQVACVQPDNQQLRLRASSNATWTGVPCDTTNDCQFAFAAGNDLVVTATFP